MLLAAEAMLMIEPLPLFSMPGRKALIVRYIERTLRSKANDHSSSLQSSTLPACTKPAQLKSTSTGPWALAAAAIAAGSSTSSCRGVQPSSAASASRLISVAMTRAPSRAKASAVARPMPCAAAVTRAVFPARRGWVMVVCGG